MPSCVCCLPEFQHVGEKHFFFVSLSDNSKMHRPHSPCFNPKDSASTRLRPQGSFHRKPAVMRARLVFLINMLHRAFERSRYRGAEDPKPWKLKKRVREQRNQESIRQSYSSCV